MSGPYRVPPVTGPTTRREKLSARVKVAADGCPRWLGPMLRLLAISAFGVGLVMCMYRHPPKPPAPWLIECPNSEPWVSPRADAENGKLYARDPEGRRVILPDDCLATELTQ